MSPKVWAVCALAVAAGGLAFVAFGNLGENLVYYWSPADLDANAGKAVGATVRLGGLVKTGTVKQEGEVLSFVVEDGAHTVPVRATQVPPAMFREGIGVVVEGSLGADGVFTSKRILVKHDNEYRAPTDGALPDLGTVEGIE